jgi:hypothetical protein
MFASLAPYTFANRNAKVVFIHFIYVQVNVLIGDIYTNRFGATMM